MAEVLQSPPEFLKPSLKHADPHTLPPAQIDFSDDPRGAVNMRATFQVPMSFDKVWRVVTDPDEFTRVFSGTFKGYHDLVVHEDDGAGHRSLEMERDQWFDMIIWRGSVSTHLYLEEDRSQGLIDFRLGRPGFMKVFEGCWQITPLDKTLSEVALYQTLKPSIPPLVPNKAFFIQKFTRKVTEDMVNDLRTEATRGSAALEG